MIMCVAQFALLDDHTEGVTVQQVLADLNGDGPPDQYREFDGTPGRSATSMRK